MSQPERPLPPKVVLARALHDADCGCKDFGDPWTDEDDRYIRAVEAVWPLVPASRRDALIDTAGQLIHARHNRVPRVCDRCRAVAVKIVDMCLRGSDG